MELTLSVIILATIAVVVTSAPTLPEGPKAMEQEKNRLLQDIYRDRRSQYPQYAQYGTPCAAAAAASSPIPAIAPAAYQVNLSPYHPYAPAPAPAPASHSYYGVPHYRSFEFEPEQEMLSYSDMDHMMSEHMPMARYGYAVPAPTHPAVYAPPPPVASGPAYGVFPNAKTGGCSVPLLFSCSPSIVPGHVVQNQPQGYGNAYRGVEALSHHEPKENHEEPAVQDHLTPVHESSHSSQTVVRQ